MRTRKFLSVLLGAVMLCGILSGCGNEKNSGIEVQTAAETTATTEQASYPEKVVYQSGNFKITFTGFELKSEYETLHINYIFENTGEKDLAYHNILGVYINGWQLHCEVGVFVDAGKKGVGTIVIEKKDLDDAGITSITDVGLSGHVELGGIYDLDVENIESAKLDINPPYELMWENK